MKKNGGGTMEVFAAPIGLSARGIVYISMGFLAFRIVGGYHAEVDQRSALEKVLLRSAGRLLVALMAIGFVFYAFWRFRYMTVRTNVGALNNEATQ